MVGVATAVSVIIGVIVSSLQSGLTSVAKGVGNGLKALGKKLGQILPGMVGAIASFVFRTAGEARRLFGKECLAIDRGSCRILSSSKLRRKGVK